MDRERGEGREGEGEREGGREEKRERETREAYLINDIKLAYH